MKPRSSSWLFLAIAAFVPLRLLAYSFVPSELEWAAWPGYCKARYVTTNIGGESQWVTSYPRAEVELWRSSLGEETFEDVHHYCAGIIWFNRSKFEPDKERRTRMLKEALGEARYTYLRIPSDSGVSSAVAITLASVEDALGEHDSALSYLEKAIESLPDDSGPYTALALHYRNLKQLDLAKKTLLRGDEALKGESAEIHYNLGLVEIELGDLEAATSQAKRAYDLGHPLPGLKNKLIALGAWPETHAGR